MQRSSKFVCRTISSLATLKVWAIPENFKQGCEGGGGLRTWNFRGIGEKVRGNSSGQLKKKWNFQGIFKKDSCGISMGLDF